MSERITAKENVELTLTHGKPKWIPLRGVDFAATYINAVMDRYPSTAEAPHGYDDFGVEYTYSPDVNAPMPLENNLVMTDITRWREQIKWPDLDSVDWAAVAAKDLDGLDRENVFSIVVLSRNQFERLHSLMGFEGALEALIEEPEALEEYLDAFCEWRLRVIDKVVEYYRPDAIMLNDDYAMASGMMIPPRIWREQFKPRMKQLLDRIHSYNLHALVHCCGLMREIFPDFLEMGVEGLMCQHLNNIPELKEKYNERMTFIGCLDNVFVLDAPDVTEEKAVAEVHRVIRELAEGGHYMLMQNIISPMSRQIVDREFNAYNKPLREKYQAGWDEEASRKLEERSQNNHVSGFTIIKE